jgi:cupin 2 domain-containing protein
MKTPNIFHLNKIPTPLDSEIIDTLFNTHNNIKIQRIISAGQTSPPNFWYDQPTSEWVILLQGNATIEFENNEIEKLEAGNYLFIPSHRRHRVTYTSSAPPCIWLAIHFDSH